MPLAKPDKVYAVEHLYGADVTWRYSVPGTGSSDWETRSPTVDNRLVWNSN